jgi:hypothetical protein
MKSIIALFAINSDVDEFNIEMRKINNIKLITIRAEDNHLKKGFIMRKNKQNTNKKYAQKKKKNIRNCGLR